MLNFQAKKSKLEEALRDDLPKNVFCHCLIKRGVRPLSELFGTKCILVFSSQKFYMLGGGNLCNAREKRIIFRVVVPNIIYIILSIEIDFAVNRKAVKIGTFLLYREDSWRHGGFSHACTVTKKQSLSMQMI